MDLGCTLFGFLPGPPCFGPNLRESSPGLGQLGTAHFLFLVPNTPWIIYKSLSTFVADHPSPSWENQDHTCESEEMPELETNFKTQMSMLSIHFKLFFGRILDWKVQNKVSKKRI